MNPFLENYWPDVHTSFLVYLRSALVPYLPEGFQARIEESIAIDSPDETGELVRHGGRADVLVAYTPGQGEYATAGGVAITEPDVYVQLESERPRHVEIIDLRQGGKVITVIEVLSPTNKESGRQAYLMKRQLCLQAGVNFVEIDLLRRGRYVLALPIEQIPLRKKGTYMVCASRGDSPATFQVWSIPLLQPLPVIGIPLRSGEQPIPVALQPIISQIYQAGGFARTIKYGEPLDPPLPLEAQQHLAARLSESSNKQV